MASFNVGANCFLNNELAEKVVGPNPSTERGTGTKVNRHPTLPLIIYPSGKFIVVKNFLNPTECFVYRGHAAITTVAKFSPNGFWVASADSAGKVRVWSWDHPEHLTKMETPAFASAVLDLDWDSESKKIAASGEGGGSLVKCFTWDTANSAGEMVGQNKRVQSVTYKPTRPFRIMSGGEDFRTIFYAGPPFKFDHSNDSHTNFVNLVRYAPNGTKIVSVGTDKKIQIYDGATGQPVADIPNAHDGGIYSVSWNAGSTHFATASADKTVKVWNAETLACEQSFPLSAAPQVSDAQVAVIWTADNLVSLSLNGDLNILNPATGLERKIQDHQTAISAFCLDRDGQTLYTGSSDGVICTRSVQPGAEYLHARKVVGTDKRSICGGAHGGKVTGMVIVGADLLSVGWDDKLRVASIATNAFHSEEALNGQPAFITHSGDLVAILTNNELAFYRGATKISATAVSTLGYTPLCAALVGEEEIAVGGSDNKTHIYSLDGALGLTTVTEIVSRSPITALAYSVQGFLAIGNSLKQIDVYERGTWAAKVVDRWVNHTSKITALAWSPTGSFLASGSLDENVYIWNIGKNIPERQLSFAHVGGVSGVAWKAEGRLVSAGNDGTVVAWNVPVPTL